MSETISKNSQSTEIRWDILLFYAFITISPLSLRKIIYLFKIDFSFNEYTSVYIYLSDIVLISIFILYILYNINYILSNINIPTIKMCSLFHVEQNSKKNRLINRILIVPRGTINLLNKTYTLFIHNFVLIFPLFMALFSLFSIMWTTNTTIAIFRSIKLFEFITLYYLLIFFVPRGTNTQNNNAKIGTTKNTILFHVEQINHIKKKYSLFFRFFLKVFCSTWNKIETFINVPRETFIKNSLSLLVLTTTIQAIIDISQFLMQKSIGLLWLRESIFSPTIPGTAKIILSDQALIRAYGLFPHPNIFGGYLVFSIISTLLLLKLFHVEQFNSTKNHPGGTSMQASNSTAKVTFGSRIDALFKIVPRGTILLQLSLLIQCTSLFLTFSKSAILGLCIGLFYIFKKNMFHVEHVGKKMLLILAIFVFSWSLLDFNHNSLFIKSLCEREFYLNVSRGTFFDYPILGVGAGQFIFEVAKIPNIETWQLQPVHNVPLLILNEYGLFIALGFIFFLWKIFTINCSTWNNEEKKQVTYLKGILLAFIFIMMFDHYFWDIQQGQIIFWILIGLLASKRCKGNTISL